MIKNNCKVIITEGEYKDEIFWLNYTVSYIKEDGSRQYLYVCTHNILGIKKFPPDYVKEL